MYVLYMHVHMYLYLRADKARMCTRCTGSLGRYIGTRRRIVCVRACLRALRRAKKCQAAQARWWYALEIPAAGVSRRGFLFLPPSSLGKVVSRRPTWRLPKLGWQRHRDLHYLDSANATPIVGSTSTFPGCVHCGNSLISPNRFSCRSSHGLAKGPWFLGGSGGGAGHHQTLYRCTKMVLTLKNTW